MLFFDSSGSPQRLYASPENSAPVCESRAIEALSITQMRTLRALSSAKETRRIDAFGIADRRGTFDERRGHAIVIAACERKARIAEAIERKHAMIEELTRIFSEHRGKCDREVSCVGADFEA